MPRPKGFRVPLVTIEASLERPTAEHFRVIRVEDPILGREWRWQLVDRHGVIRGMSAKGWLMKRHAIENAMIHAAKLGWLAVWGPGYGQVWNGVVVELIPAGEPEVKPLIGQGKHKRKLGTTMEEVLKARGLRGGNLLPPRRDGKGPAASPEPAAPPEGPRDPPEA